ncbi:3'-5' exonuclease [Pseudomonas sp. Irchel 3E13]|uniref:3'-5' exonuclease n=1 Tax=Pseudomonas sp. Irchel 3E13 TaxID=2008975 RepID=UPI000BA367A9|nr:3'-5' exonuclease [Pseudomonas sp. Irchel 3E13]
MDINWTSEQLVFLDCTAPLIRLRAFAGASKTTSLEGYSRRYPKLRFLYLAYNKSIRDEAKNRFPSNVFCATTHQLAYRSYRAKFEHKLEGALRLGDMAKVLETNDWTLVRAVVDMVSNFLCSPLDVFHESHIPIINRKPGSQMPPSFLEVLFKMAEDLWARMIDPEDSSVPILHDGYLKLYLLSKPDLSRQYDVILADEAQDLNGLTLELIKMQSCRKIFVGDRHQVLYRFRGADNALDDPELNDAVDLNLTRSFRFGPATASLANMILSFKGETLKVVGAGARTKIKTALDSTAKRPALLHRTVMGVITSALDFTAAGRKVYWVGGIDGYQISNIEDLYWFSEGQSQKVKNKRLLKEFNDWDQYLAIAEETKDREMVRAIKIITGSDDLEGKLRQMRAMTVKDESLADITLATAHRSKGLEWDNVALMDDFPDPLDPLMDHGSREDELALLYVATTRARHQLAVNQVVIGLMRECTYRQRLAASQSQA